MRRALTLCVLSLIVVSCTKKGALAPDEVLRRAALAGRSIQSAHFTVQADASVRESDESSATKIKIAAEGDMSDGGKQMSLNADINVSRPHNDQQIDLQGGVVVIGEGEVYVRIDSLSVVPEDPIFSSEMFGELQGKWWSLPASASGADIGVSPDPQFLAMQSEVVSVVRDRGIHTIDGRDAYRFDVTVDKEKLDAFFAEVARQRGEEEGSTSWQDFLESTDMQGELWIDAETFYLHRVIWEIASTDPNDPYSIAFVMRLSNHDEPIRIAPPEDAEPLPVPGLLPGMGEMESFSLPMNE